MVNTSTSPKIQYGYANGSSNQVRQLSVSYPSGRAIEFDYGSSGGVDEQLSRVQKLIDGATTLVEYNYLGASMPVQVRYPQPDVTMDLWGGTAGVYTGLDRFGRIADLPWIHDLSGSPTDLARIKYGYNRASSPTYARDEVARAANADLDQLYGYDGLQRLIDFQQGELSGTNTSISSSTLAQDWDLDQVGNWDGFNQEVTGILNQTRTHNRVNEITGISNSSGQPVWVDPGYDDAGNMTLTPRPSDPTNGFTLTFDAWNRITKVETTGASPKLVAQYAYDGRNHRTSKRLYDSSGSLASTIEHFYNSDWQCVEEQETPVSSSTSMSTYVWGIRYIDDLVCRDTATDRLYAMQDRQYKMVGIVNATGNVVERYSYTPYGETFFYAADFTPRTSSAYAWVYLYTSRRLDPETGLYYFRNRYYDPGLGRFCSRDFRYLDGLNLYRPYFSPNHVDPFGQKTCFIKVLLGHGGGDKDFVDKQINHPDFGRNKCRRLGLICCYADQRMENCKDKFGGRSVVPDWPSIPGDLPCEGVAEKINSMHSPIVREAERMCIDKSDPCACTSIIVNYRCDEDMRNCIDYHVAKGNLTRNFCGGDRTFDCKIGGWK